MSKQAASSASAVAAALMLLLAAVVVVWPGLRDLSLDEDAYGRRSVEVVKETIGPSGTTTETTRSPADDSTVERALGSGGLLLVRIGVAAAAAFLAGAVTMRVLLGRYGFKAGGVEMEDVIGDASESSAQALTALGELVDAQRATIASTMRIAADALRQSADLTRRVDELEHR